jgi:hypothetical protein
LVEVVGLTVCVPELGTFPIPSIETSLASVVCQVRATPSPELTEVGEAVIDAVGAGAVTAGGGGGGAGAVFLLQPAESIAKDKTASGAE